MPLHRRADLALGWPSALPLGHVGRPVGVAPILDINHLVLLHMDEDLSSPTISSSIPWLSGITRAKAVLTSGLVDVDRLTTSSYGAEIW